MIKSNKAIAHITETSPYTYRADVLTTYEVIEETKEFLEKYFKGSYEKTIENVSHRNLKFSPEGFAYIFKLIFKAVRGESLIKINAELLSDTLKFTIKFDTSKLTDELRSLILKTAKLSEIDLSFFDEGIELELAVCHDIAPFVHAVSLKYVFSAFINMFFAPPDVKDDSVKWPPSKVNKDH